MKESKKTLLFLAIAAISILLSYSLAPKQSDQEFNDVGQSFFPQYTNPLDAQSLEITSFNAKAGTNETFSVSLKNGRWTLPSHHNYPTDAGPRMEALAAKLIGLKRDEIRTRVAADHQSLGLIDPSDKTVSSLTGRGKHVVLKDKNGNVLCDYIFGDKVPNRKQNFNFVRLTKQNTVYAVANDVDLTVKFDDWVQTNLLQIKEDEIFKIAIEDYSLSQGKVKSGQSYKLARTRQGWYSKELKTGEKLNNNAIKEMNEAFAKLKLIAVSPKPLAFAQKLKEDSDTSIDAVTIKSLQDKGYHLTAQGLLSDEGECIITTKSGIVYTLRFGDAFIPINAIDTANSRYLLATVEHDPSISPEPKKLAEPTAPSDKTNKKAMKSYHEKMEQYQNSEDNYRRWQNSQIKAKAQVQALQKRFADWYYIIDHKSFKNAKTALKDLIAK